VIDEVWASDHKVLVEIVRQIEVEGRDFADEVRRAGVRYAASFGPRAPGRPA
jgi:hypothetical protein